MDHLTSMGNRVSFARVCMEVDVDSPLSLNFFVKCEGKVMEIRVEYQGIPAKCEHCRVFGHDTKNCVPTQVAHLDQMQKETEEDKEEGWQTVKSKGKKKIGEPNEGEGSQGGNSPPLLQPQHRESLIPVNSDAPLKNKIVNLCFADDLMIFCKGHVQSVELIKQGLIEFQVLSCLTPNPNKSHIFFSGCDHHLRRSILEVT